MITKLEAILSLVKGAEVTVYGDEVTWHKPEVAPVTEAEVLSEVSRLEAEWNATEYQRLRAAEYPPMSDYLDGVVKGDQTQVDKYVAECLAVKAKYPKPE